MVCRTVQYSLGEEKFTLALPDHVRPAATIINNKILNKCGVGFASFVALPTGISTTDLLEVKVLCSSFE